MAKIVFGDALFFFSQKRGHVLITRLHVAKILFGLVIISLLCIVWLGSCENKKKGNVLLLNVLLSRKKPKL